jgi:DNA-binding response OmpR family regulator
MKRLLVVEDEPDIASVIDLTLAHAGYRLEFADSLASARGLVDGTPLTCCSSTWCSRTATGWTCCGS